MNMSGKGCEKVKEYVKQCEICQRSKLTRIRPRALMALTDTPQKGTEKISLDVFGIPLPRTEKGYRYLLTLQDLFTYLVLIPLRDLTGEETVKGFIEHYVYLFGAPKNVLTDQGSNFLSSAMREVERLLGIEHIKTTAYHPQSNGGLEKTHAVVKDLLRTTLNHKTEQNKWDEKIHSYASDTIRPSMKAPATRRTNSRSDIRPGCHHKSM